jgi:hypothetical protein
MKGYIDAAGFVNTAEKVGEPPHGTLPANPKMKEIGNWGFLELDVGLKGFCVALMTRILAVRNLKKGATWADNRYSAVSRKFKCIWQAYVQTYVREAFIPTITSAPYTDKSHTTFN